MSRSTLQRATGIPSQLMQPDLTGPVDTEMGLVDPTDLDQQGLIALLTRGKQLVAPLVVDR